MLGRIPKRDEPYWLPEDLAFAKALLAYEADICPGCGQSRTESTGPEDSTHYRVDIVHCWGCAARARAERAYLSDGPTSGRGDPDGLLLATHRVT